MASAALSVAQAPIPTGGGTRDDLDALFAFSDDEQQPAANTTLPNNNNQRSAPTATEPKDLGIDSEVKIRKARAPTAKLDESLLLSAKGIPSLRTRLSRALPSASGSNSSSTTSTNTGRVIKAKKGNEFRDVEKLLHIYQLWADDMFPKARFRDALEMIEKLGHRRRVQVSRMAWVEEAKRASRGLDEPDADADAEPDGEDGDFVMSGALPAPGEAAGVGEAEDDLYAAPTPAPGAQGAGEGVATGDARAGEPDEDELDAMLAEDDLMAADALPAARAGTSVNAATGMGGGNIGDDFGDEWEAMQEMGVF